MRAAPTGAPDHGQAATSVAGSDGPDGSDGTSVLGAVSANSWAEVPTERTGGVRIRTVAPQRC